MTISQRGARLKKMILVFAAILFFSSGAIAQIGIEQFGDSTSLGLTWNGSSFVIASPTSPDQLYIDMQSRFGAGQVVVYNRGVGSTCAKDLLYGPPDFASRIASSTAQIITLNYGSNDNWYCNQTVAQYSAQMDQLVKIVKAAGKIPVLIEPTPTLNRNNPNLYNYVSALSQVAINNGVAIIQHYRLWQAGGVWKVWLSDDTHPTSEGYKLKGDTEFQVLSPIVYKLLNP